jgi:hypothetical protein
VNLYYLIAGFLAIALGVVHSVLGEVLIFRHLRETDVFSDDGISKLKKRHYKTIWSTWHLVTLFGWGFGAILIIQSRPDSLETTLFNISSLISISFFVCAVYWLIGTRGKHPAWIILGIISILVWLAKNSY